MTSIFYDEVEIEDMDWDEDKERYTYPCPCGDLFEISLTELRSGEEVGTCPSCSLRIRVVYDPEDFDDEGGNDGCRSSDKDAVAATPMGVH